MAERVAGMGAQALREAEYGIMAEREDAEGAMTGYDLESAEDGVMEPVRLGGEEMPNSVVTASTTNQIVRTAINGMAGTVKEWVSNGDVAIGLTVTILNNDGTEYPWEAVERVKRLLSGDEALEIESRWLNDVWGVTRVVVESYSMTGHTERNYEVVEVSLASDKEYLIAEEVEA